MEDELLKHYHNAISEIQEIVKTMDGRLGAEKVALEKIERLLWSIYERQKGNYADSLMIENTAFGFLREAKRY